jgi:3-phosphoinositide dependent protein kinase-1
MGIRYFDNPSIKIKGCTIYLMEMGEFPFHSNTEWGIFEKIKNNDVDYPSTMDPDVKDFVQKLLKIDPTQRLGAGPPGKENFH